MAESVVEREWQPPETAPKDGRRIRLLLESEATYEEPIPSLLIGGWRRVSARDKIIGWMPADDDAALSESP